MVNMIDGIHSYMSYDSRISDSFDQTTRNDISTLAWEIGVKEKKGSKCY